MLRRVTQWPRRKRFSAPRLFLYDRGVLHNSTSTRFPSGSALLITPPPFKTPLISVNLILIPPLSPLSLSYTHHNGRARNYNRKPTPGGGAHLHPRQPRWRRLSVRSPATQFPFTTPPPDRLQQARSELDTNPPVQRDRHIRHLSTTLHQVPFH